MIGAWGNLILFKNSKSKCWISKLFYLLRHFKMA